MNKTKSENAPSKRGGGAPLRLIWNTWNIWKFPMPKPFIGYLPWSTLKSVRQVFYMGHKLVAYNCLEEISAQRNVSSKWNSSLVHHLDYMKRLNWQCLLLLLDSLVKAVAFQTFCVDKVCCWKEGAFTKNPQLGPIPSNNFTQHIILVSWALVI